MDGVGGVQFQLCQKLDRCRGARGTVVAVPADEEQGKLVCVYFLNSSGVGGGGLFCSKVVIKHHLLPVSVALQLLVYLNQPI